MNEIIPMGRVNQRLVTNIVTFLERSVDKQHHRFIEAQLPFMRNRDHLNWCVGGVWGFIHVLVNSLKEIAEDPKATQSGSSQQREFKNFLNAVRRNRPIVTLHIWYSNDTDWQVKFLRIDEGVYVAMNAWIDDYNVFDKIITDCAANFETTRADILKTWGGESNE